MKDESAKIYVQVVPDLSKVHEIKGDLNELAEALEKANDLIDRLAKHNEIEVSFIAKSGNERLPAFRAGVITEPADEQRTAKRAVQFG